MGSRYKSIDDMLKAEYERTLKEVMTNPEAPYIHVETVSEMKDRIAQNIKDRKLEEHIEATTGKRVTIINGKIWEG